MKILELIEKLKHFDLNSLVVTGGFDETGYAGILLTLKNNFLLLDQFKSSMKIKVLLLKYLIAVSILPDTCPH